LSDDVVWKDIGIPEPMHGKSETEKYMENWFKAFPDMKAVVKNRVATDDQVASEIEFTGTNSGPMQMMPGAPALPATGKKVIGKGTYFVRVQNNKGVEVHTYPDGAGMMMQLGVVPKPM
jgi:predicted ester cyclase